MKFWSALSQALGSTPKEGVIYARLTLGNPHAGLDLFSETPDFDKYLKISGMTLNDVKRRFCGRVLDREKLDKKQDYLLNTNGLKLSEIEMIGLLK